MFEIDKSGSADEFRVVDPEDGTELRFLDGSGPESPCDLFAFRTQGRPIPLVVEYVRSGQTKQTIARILSFGDFSARPGARLKFPDLKEVEFASPGEHDAAYLRAVEALLAYGGFYNGLSLSDGKYVVHVESGPLAGFYTLSTFGYRQITAAGDE